MTFSKALDKVFFWVKCARYQSYAQSFLPAILAFAVVAGKDEYELTCVDFVLGGLAVLGVILAHSGVNLLDDYFDYTSHSVQKRKEMVDGGMRARSLKCAYLDSGMATPKQLLCVAILFCLIATACGTVIYLCRGIPILVCFTVGAFLAFFNSAPPIRLSYHYLGELVVGALFGPVLMSGVSYSLCGQLDSSVVFLSIPMGILVANILYVHSILDLEADKRAGKFTFAALWGNQRRAVAFCGLLLATCYLSVIAGVILKALSPVSLLVMVTVPVALELFLSMKLYLRDPDKPVERKRWHGPMECWDRICKAGISWFMFRWYLSRNLLTMFAICLLTSIIISYFA